MDPASDQLCAYKQHWLKNQSAQNNEQHSNTDGDGLRMMSSLAGCPLGSITAALSLGVRGPLLSEDTSLIEELTHFNRERIPERTIHSKGAGASGYFELTTKNGARFCSANMFQGPIGSRTLARVRFSMITRAHGGADTVRDGRGMSVRFYSEEGNWDLLGTSVPVLFTNDPFQVLRFVHANRPNPVTNIADPNAGWDFMTLRPETMYQVTWANTRRGLLDGFRCMDTWSGNAYKLINPKGEAVYAKFKWTTDQGLRFMEPGVAARLADPDYSVRDLYDAIARGDYPSWRLHIQVMTFDQAREWEFNPFDPTKVWPEAEFPLIELGRLVLNKNPENYFAEVEQMALTPKNRVPGVEYSPDRTLLSRLVAYRDAHLHRIGPNHHLIPVNQPLNPILAPTMRDGAMTTGANGGNAPNYYPCSFMPEVHTDPARFNEPRIHLQGPRDVDRFVLETDDNYTQVTELYLSYSEQDRQEMYENIGQGLSVCYEFIQQRALGHFRKIHPTYEAGVRRVLERLKDSNSK